MIKNIPPLYPYSSFFIKNKIEEEMYFFNSGKSALLFIVNVLKQQHDNLVFVIPAYTCFSIVNVVIQAKVEYNFVDISDDLDIELNDFNNLLDRYNNKKIVLLATSLFGIVVRNYKALYKDVIIIEDLAQSRLNNKSDADFQFVSFGKGKLISSWNGGAVLTKDSLFKKKYNALIVKQDFMQSFIFSGIQKIVSKYFWFLIEYSRLNPEKTKKNKQEYINIYRLSSIKCKWILTSLQNIDLCHRIKISNELSTKIDENLKFNLRCDVPYLRFPIKKNINIQGVSFMYDYRYTYEHAKEIRGREFEIPKILSYHCSFIPTHDLIDEGYVECIAKVVNSL